jgi:hypothetical protein
MALAKRIAAVSLAPADLDQVRKLLEQLRSRLPRPWTWGTDADADVLLIDVDSVYGHMDWLRAQSQGRRIISLSSRAGAEHDVTLQRPMTAEGLLAALAAIDGDAPGGNAAAAPVSVVTAPAPGPVARVGETYEPAPQAEPEPVAATTAAAAAPSAPPPAAPAPAPAPAPEPAVAPAPMPTELYLADYCSADVLPQPARLVRGDAPALTIDASADVYYGPRELKPLLPYCNGPIAQDEWQPVSQTVMEGLRASGTAQPLARLLWLFALASSNGQLLPGLELNARFRLAKWPQIEREYPKHFRIATVMMKGPATLTEIMEQSGATLPDVIDFVNAYSAIRFVEMEGAAAPPPEAAAPGGLLSRLRARARRG